MARKVSTAFISSRAFISGVASILFLASIYHHLFSDKPLIAADNLRRLPLPLYSVINANNVIREDEEEEEEFTQQISRHVSSVSDSITTVSILLPEWEVLVIVSPETPLPSESVAGNYTCLFPNADSSPARHAGFLSSPYRTTFKCEFPVKLRRRLPFPQPVLIKSTENAPEIPSSAPDLLRWNYLVYDSLSTENDVILFVKGLNNRQGVNRSPSHMKCVFGDNGVKTAVTTSLQEVFRCQLPDPTALSNSVENSRSRIKISLETAQSNNQMVPSVAYYTPPRKITPDQPKSLICACTMVYNVAKFLKEWVIYHSKIGVSKFILYDNESDDELESVVDELVAEGYNVTILFWIWPKTQEAGFSHSAIYASDSCSWMMYIDVDEFIYSPSWHNLSNPSNEMLTSLLPKSPTSKIGQVMISCYEFGPSNQRSHPLLGVTQGYNCRRRTENRHKSIVLLRAIDDSLLNVIHHFHLRHGYRVKKLGVENVVVNHYKFQAWDEFKSKFRRRVSAYVVDWTKAVNLGSKDRTPGLGYSPVEPVGWPKKFCEVYDDRLKNLTQRWFGSESSSGSYLMAWQ